MKFLADRCKALYYCHSTVVCRLSVVVCRLCIVYCVKTAEARIMQFSLKCSANALTLCLPSLIPKFEWGPLDPGAQTGVGWFSIEFATLYLGNGVR